MIPQPTITEKQSKAAGLLDLRGHLEVGAELAKIDKKVTKIEKELKSKKARLENPKFAAKAPEHVVEKAREECNELQRQIDSLLRTRSDLEKLEQV